MSYTISVSLLVKLRLVLVGGLDETIYLPGVHIRKMQDQLYGIVHY